MKLLVVSDYDTLQSTEQLREETEKYCEKNNLMVPYGYYMHGILEDYWGYDLCTLVNLDKLELQELENISWYGKVKETIVFIKPGKYDIEVLNYPNPCIGYFWINSFNRVRGLICDANDVESIQYAEQCFNECKESI